MYYYKTTCTKCGHEFLVTSMLVWSKGYSPRYLIITCPNCNFRFTIIIVQNRSEELSALARFHMPLTEAEVHQEKLGQNSYIHAGESDGFDPFAR